MIAFSDENRISMARGMLAGRRYDEVIDMLRAVNTREAREISADASYQYGKLLVSEGQYGFATEYFARAANHHPSTVVRSLAQERNHLINSILNRRTRPVVEMLHQLEQVRIATAVAMPAETFAPLISFVGCPAAYRSGYDPNRSDPLSRLIRLIKRPAEAAETMTEREHATDRIAEILASFTYMETTVLRDADFVVPVPSDQDREAVRGYSIPMILARRLSASCGIPLHPGVIETSGPLPDLRTIPRWSRELAITDAYVGTEKSTMLEGMKVIIVDDVVTSGATLRQVAFVLKDHGAEQAYAVVLAHSESSRI